MNESQFGSWLRAYLISRRRNLESHREVEQECLRGNEHNSQKERYDKGNSSKNIFVSSGGSEGMSKMKLGRSIRGDENHGDSKPEKE